MDTAALERKGYVLREDAQSVCRGAEPRQTPDSVLFTYAAEQEHRGLPRRAIRVREKGSVGFQAVCQPRAHAEKLVFLKYSSFRPDSMVDGRGSQQRDGRSAECRD